MSLLPHSFWLVDEVLVKKDEIGKAVYRWATQPACQFVSQSVMISQSVSQSIAQSVSQSVSQSASQSVSPSASQLVSQSVSPSAGAHYWMGSCPSVNQSFNHSVIQSFSHSFSQSFGRSSKQSVDKLASQSGNQPDVCWSIRLSFSSFIRSSSRSVGWSVGQLSAYFSS